MTEQRDKHAAAAWFWNTQHTHPGLQKTDFLPVQTDFYFVKPIQFA